jgi:hypothetical protein
MARRQTSWIDFTVVALVLGAVAIVYFGIPRFDRVLSTEDIFSRLGEYERSGQIAQIYHKLLSGHFKARIHTNAFVDDWQRRTAALGPLLDRDVVRRECKGNRCHISVVGLYVQGMAHEEYDVIKEDDRGWQIQTVTVMPMPMPRPELHDELQEPIGPE